MKIRRSYHSNLKLVEYYIPGRKKIYHRLDGPALKFNDGEQWYRYGKPHRDDGPAIIWHDSEEWWLNGILFTKEEWFEALPEDKKLKMLYSEYFIGSRNA